MATSSIQQAPLLSPAELAYLRRSLSQGSGTRQQPIRPDGRTATQFRPLTAEAGGSILPGTNGSARVCFADGTEAVAGVKCEIERTVGANVRDLWGDRKGGGLARKAAGKDEEDEEMMEGGDVDEDEDAWKKGSADWVEISVEIPGCRDDDPGTAFLAAMLSEAVLADGGGLASRLVINRGWHWRIYLDILLISPPLSYPLPLLSLTTHLALLATRLPRLKSEGEEDPMFDDDWGASEYLFPRPGSITSSSTSKKGKQAAATQPARPVFLPRPPVTLLVMSVGGNIVFDPTREELAVADAALAVSFGEDPYAATSDGLGPTSGQKRKRNLRLLAVRTVDPPSRLTAPGVPDTRNPATWAGGVTGSGVAIDKLQALQQVKGKEEEQQRMQRLWRRAEEEDEAAGQVEGVWRAPRGGAKAALLAEMVERVLEEGGVAEEILDALEAVDVE